MKSFAVLFVCMGNICRSPTAHGVMLHNVMKRGLQPWISVDSAGTHNYHPGSAPDRRAQEHAAARGYDLSALRARQVTDADFERFDLILVMDWDNLEALQSRCPSHHRHKIRRLTEFSVDLQSAVVPDPYYGPSSGFDQVLDLVEDSCKGLLDHIVGQ